MQRTIRIAQRNGVAGHLFALMPRYADKPAIIEPRLTRKYGQLLERASIFALHMRRQGIGQSSLVAIDVKSPSLCAEMVIAASLVGCRWTFASFFGPGFPLKVTHLLHVNPKKYPSGPGIIDVTKAWAQTPEEYRDARHIEFTGSSSVEAPWMLLGSSGTTGLPKYLYFSEDMFLRRTRGLAATELTVGDQFIGASLFLVTSSLFVRYCFSVLLNGGRLVRGDYEFMARQGVCHVRGSPRHFTQLMSQTPAPCAPLIRSARASGSAPSEVFIREMLRYFEDVTIGYGSSEAGGVSSQRLTSVEDLRYGLGVPRQGVDIQIVDDAGQLLPPAAEGIVRIRSHGQVSSYVENAQLSAQVFRDGWFHPGDMGYLDTEGRLHITGRLNDLLNIGGVKINAEELDRVLLHDEDVQDAMAYKHPGGVLGEMLSALLVLRDGVDPLCVVDRIKSNVIAQLGDRCVPEAFFMTTETPRNANGKSMRRLAVDAALKGTKIAGSTSARHG